jgi:hypothetical protein
VNANAPLPGITTFDAREPYPEWHGIQYLTGDGIGNYNAFSAKLSQRFSRSLTTLFSYTWSKALHAGEPALPIVRLRSGRVQYSAALRRFGSLYAAVR